VFTRKSSVLIVALFCIAPLLTACPPRGIRPPLHPHRLPHPLLPQQSQQDSTNLAAAADSDVAQPVDF
jgi:hypothetical protein